MTPDEQAAFAFALNAAAVSGDFLPLLGTQTADWWALVHSALKDPRHEGVVLQLVLQDDAGPWSAWMAFKFHLGELVLDGVYLPNEDSDRMSCPDELEHYAVFKAGGP